MSLVKCPNCGHIWKCKSTKKYVTCPNCMRKVQPERLEGIKESQVKLRSPIVLIPSSLWDKFLELLRKYNAVIKLDSNHVIFDFPDKESEERFFREWEEVLKSWESKS